MIGMRIFFTALLAIDFISPIQAIIIESDAKKKFDAVVTVAIYAVAIVFIWII